VSTFNDQLANQSEQDAAIMQMVEAKVNEFRTIIQNKDEQVKQLNNMVIQLKEELNRTQLDSDKMSLSALTKVRKFRIIGIIGS
jgi:ribosome biogenesis protein Nip4